MILNQKGFTLIEALLALLITGTLSLISFPPLERASYSLGECSLNLIGVTQWPD